MTDSLYDNPSHWKEMHHRYGGSLKAVGRSGLSETYNFHKYRSEEATFSEVLKQVVIAGKKNGDDFHVLDVGAGTGYWLNVVMREAKNRNILPKVTAIDLSEEALDELKLHLPGTECVVENAGLADPGMMKGKFDLVMSNYCLHHITNTGQFKNALQLAVQSVKPGGFLLIMDCLIDRKYSPYYEIDADRYAGSGLSRPLQWVDQAAEQNNMRRISMTDPISFLMNNVLEADSGAGYRLMHITWKILHRIFKSDRLTQLVMPLVYAADRYLKKRNLGYSTRLVIYQRQMK